MAWMNGRRTVRCRRCYEKGHNIRNCPQNSPEQKAAYADGVRARACSWCGEAKHNKTGCAKRKAQMAEYITQNSEHRRGVLADMRARGLGIGALVSTVKSVEEHNPASMYIITDIDWDRVQLKNPSSRLLIAQCIANGESHTLSVPNDSDIHRYRWNDAYVVNPVKDVDSIVPPADWLRGASNVEQYFK